MRPVLDRGLLCFAFLLSASGLQGQGLLPPLREPEVREARKLLAAMKQNPRGPYAAIRWYCEDGTEHPAPGAPCKERGGGYQHAELSAQGRRLAQLALHAGSILTGLPFEEFLDRGRDYHRLKAMVLEKYLIENDDGWVLRKARFYRGARQIEDEQKFGRQLLIELLRDPEWNRRHYSLANELVRVVPHGRDTSIARKARALAQEIAELDPRFQPLRVKIHSLPDAGDAGLVKKFLETQSPPPEAAAKLRELLQVYAERARRQDVAALAARLGLPEEVKRDPARFLERAAALSLNYRDRISSSKDGRKNLALLDSNQALLEYCFDTYSGAGLRGKSRRELIEALGHLARLAAGAGLLSRRELEYLEQEMAALRKNPELAAEEYQRRVQYLGRSLEWARAGAAQIFGPVAQRYSAVEPAARKFLDELLRGSIALRLSQAVDRLQADADRALGVQHSVFGDSGRGVRAMNPGIAVGRLGILKDGEDIADSTGIYVIPETIADLKPAAGILTLDGGNPLSHVQLLARNLGIPNAVLPSALLPLFRPQEGREVLFAVSARGRVILQNTSRLSEAEKGLAELKQSANSAQRFDLKNQRINFSRREILALEQLQASDSGVLAGPKAANLGQLRRLFPDKVAPGLVVPFGIYLAHVERALDSSGIKLSDQIREAYRRAEEMRQRGATEAEMNGYIHPRLAHFRQTIEQMPLLAEFEAALRARLRQTFGPDGSYGVFVRSDTNAEDLPEFTGAGLNLTVPNQVLESDILRALRQVWASPFTERAYAWRARAIASPELVAPSVLLLHSVPSDKSGVLVTTNLETGNPDGVTVAISEGVGGVVDGGVAETLALERGGGVRFLSQAHAPYKRILVMQPPGGVRNVPVSGADTLLSADEIGQLREAVAVVESRYPPAHDRSGRRLPWDIEFGFAGGQLRLFQIRPLVENRRWEAAEAFRALDRGFSVSGRISLEEKPNE